jgi:molybdate transport system ATP-binding protein
VSPDGPPLVSLRGIAIHSAGGCYFPDADWDIRDGEHWAILGPNGSGKSLMACALAGQVPVAQGAITYHLGDEAVAAHDLGTTYARRGQVVLVSLAQQQALATKVAGYHQARWNSSESGDGPTALALLEHHSIFAINPFEVIPAPKDVPLFEQRRERAIDLLGLGSLLQRRVKQLSNGEMRRLLIARAVAAGPRLLILDDPFSGLDVAGRQQLHGVLNQLARDTTVVVATARPDDIPECVTHVLQVDDGRIAGTRRMDHASRKAAETADVLALGPIPADPSLAEVLAEVLVEMNGVTIRYGDALILDDVSFSLRRGEHCALLGPNGAGKSTLLSLLLADNPQGYANDLRLFGRPRGSGESIWDIKSRIGWVAPELLLHYPAGWACREVVLSGFFASVGLFRDSGPEQEAKAQRTLAWLGLDSLAERPLRELSHGNQRMVLLARALVAEPDLLVLDEPCQGLDPQHTARVNQAVDRAAREMMTSTLYVTHHAGELPSCITRVLRLRDGRAVPY